MFNGLFSGSFDVAKKGIPLKRLTYLLIFCCTTWFKEVASNNNVFFGEVSSESNGMTNYLKSDFETICTNSLQTAAQILFLRHPCDALLPVFSN